MWDPSIHPFVIHPSESSVFSTKFLFSQTFAPNEDVDGGGGVVTNGHHNGGIGGGGGNDGVENLQGVPFKFCSSLFRWQSQKVCRLEEPQRRRHQGEKQDRRQHQVQV